MREVFAPAYSRVDCPTKAWMRARARRRRTHWFRRVYWSVHESGGEVWVTTRGRFGWAAPDGTHGEVRSYARARELAAQARPTPPVRSLRRAA